MENIAMAKKEINKRADPASQTNMERAYEEQLEEYIARDFVSNVDKVNYFAKYVPRQRLADFITRYELFRKVLNVHGSVVECGVYMGGGLMTYANLSAILEPVNHQREIIGFDTFEGFPSLHSKDDGPWYRHKNTGGMESNAYEDIQEAIRLFDMNRPLSHIPKVEIVKGNAVKTIPDYMEKNPHLVISLLYLDFDIYEPTVTALKSFMPRIPKGGIIAFDELNKKQWPGETQAVIEEIGLPNLRIQRFPYSSFISYAVIE